MAIGITGNHLAVRTVASHGVRALSALAKRESNHPECEVDDSKSLQFGQPKCEIPPPLIKRATSTSMRHPGLHRLADFRSDTNTYPTREMRQAMVAAPVGNMEADEDLSVNALESYAAELLGKPKALFVPSCTQANAIALGTHLNPGEEFIAANNAHVVKYEAGGFAKHFGLSSQRLPINDRGEMSLAELEAAILPDSPLIPKAGLIELENTTDGRALRESYLADVAHLAKNNAHRELAVHMDGARLFNAAVAQEVPVSQLARYADSVSICLTKGLGAPLGALLLGEASFIESAIGNRKSLGGCMRKPGMEAAGGLYALAKHIPQLALDHQLADYLAKRLAELPGITIDGPHTNFVFLKSEYVPVQTIISEMKQEGILLGCYPGVKDNLRLVTHRNVDVEDVERLYTCLADLLINAAPLE